MAAQKMRGWCSLTTTTKAGSVQPALLGGATGPLGGANSTCWHHWYRCDTGPSTGVLMALPKATIVTGGPEGHGTPVEVEGGGLGALGLVCVHRATARQRTVALSSASGPFAAGLAADWPS